MHSSDVSNRVAAAGLTSSFPPLDNAADLPIGVFDSGYGGLTVLREIMRELPHENTIFVGDSARCPYGPRDQREVRGFVMQICSYLATRGCKLMVIACNTATAAGLADAQRMFRIPVVGVVEPGARAAAHVTRNRRVGIIATQGTIESAAYPRAINNIDAGIEVFSAAAPKFVQIAEEGIEHMSLDAKSLLDVPEYVQCAHAYLDPLKNLGIDTLVLGCTHFPLIKPLIEHVMGPGVTLVSSAEETARDVRQILERRAQLACAGAVAPEREYLTTAQNLDDFLRIDGRVLDEPMQNVAHLDLAQFFPY